MSGSVNTRVTTTATQILQGSGKMTVDGYDIGGYQNGISITWAQTEKFVMSEHQLGPIDSEIATVDFQANTELEEATLENLAIAWGMDSSSNVTSATSSKVFTLNPPASMKEHVLVFEGMSATDRTKIRTFTIAKAVRIGSSATKLQRGEKTVVPVTFKCLMVAGSFGTIVDSTKTA